MPSDLEKKAGIETFKKFKYYNAVNSLSGGNVKDWTIILNLPYEQFFIKQLMNKTEAEYQKKYHKLLLKENE